MKKIRLKDKYRTRLLITIVIISTLWLYSTILSDNDTIDKLNKCIQKHDLNYCNKNVK